MNSQNVVVRAGSRLHVFWFFVLRKVHISISCYHSPNSDGTRETPSHRFSDFKFKTYSPVAFR